MDLPASHGNDKILREKFRRSRIYVGSFPVPLVLLFLSHGETEYDGRNIAYLIVPGKKIEGEERTERHKGRERKGRWRKRGKVKEERT